MRAGDVVGNRFVVERVAGSGGMATVYRAQDRHTSAPVALKVLREAATGDERFAREAALLAELAHPRLVGYVAHGIAEGGQTFLAMEWLEGETLASRLARDGVSGEDALTLATHVAEALGVLHSRGIVHRDLKPGNLFLPHGAVSRVKILDFGIARLVGQGSLTQTGATIGTPGYMAPEQARGERDIDGRVDVYSLGCVLFRCLTGRTPFVADEPLALLLKVVLETPPRARDIRPDIPPALCDLLTAMLQKAPKDRIASASAVADALVRLGALLSSAPAPDVAAPALTATERRVMCLVLVRGFGSTGPAEETIAKGAHDARLAAVRETLQRLDARLDTLADGSLVVAMVSPGAATDLATRAARCALAIRPTLPDASIAVVVGRGVLSASAPVGEVIDRAVALLRHREAPSIRLDEVTAGLLDARFDVGGDAGGLTLEGERRAVDTARTLLGRPTPCVGRDRELASLEAMLAECRSEPMARAVLVTGAAGFGKSRLRHELLRRIGHGDDLSIWIGRADPVGAGSPLGLLGHALRGVAGVLDGEPLEVRRRKLRARVSRHVPRADVARVSEFTGELAGVPFDDVESVHLRAARGDAHLLGDQMQRAFEDLVAAECSASGLLLVLEDLHWGDGASVQFVDAALRNLEDRPFMVLALGRPEVEELFPRIWSERDVQHLRLGRLAPRSAEQLVRVVLGTATPTATVRAVVDRCAGNAFYLEELIRAVAEDRGDALPETVLAMAQARLERLDPEARRLLRAASVFGQVFWRGGAAALLGGADRCVDIDSRLDALVEREFVTRRGTSRLAGEMEYVFRHALVREAAYGMLTEEDAALGHRLAAAWLEHAGDGDAMILAEHSERGGERGAAARFYQRAAQHALAANDFAGATARAERAAGAGASGEALGRLRLLQAEAHRWSGMVSEAGACAREALALLSPGSAAWYMAGGEAAIVSARRARHDEVLALVRVLTTAVPREGTRGARIIALSRAIAQLFQGGQFEIAEAMLTGLVEDAEREPFDDPIPLARLDQARAARAMCVGEHAEFVRRMTAAAEGFESAGDARSGCMQRANVGYGLAELGDYAGAERHLRDGLSAARRLGLLSLELYALHNLGMVLARQGRLDEALEVETHAVDGFGRQGDKRLGAVALVYRAQIGLLAGDIAAAEQDALAAAEAARDVRPALAYAHAVVAQTRLAQGRRADALASARAAMAILRELGSLQDGEALVRLVHAEALDAMGDPAASRAAIAEARTRLLERAAGIDDARLRQRFLEAVRENARTLALAEAWSG